MVSTLKNSLNQETIMPSIKPEVMEFFQNRINPNMTPEQVEEVINSLNPTNSQPNPIIGTPVNLLYLQDGNNLAAVVVREDITGKLYTFSTERNLIENANAIALENLKDFQFRFQDAFNYNSEVSVNRQNNRIESLVIIKREQYNQPIPDPALATIGASSKCLLPPNLC